MRASALPLFRGCKAAGDLQSTDDQPSSSNLGLHSLKKPLSTEEADAEMRQRFAVRATSILAFIECDEGLRPKLREAIVDAMLWAQTQSK